MSNNFSLKNFKNQPFFTLHTRIPLKLKLNSKTPEYPAKEELQTEKIRERTTKKVWRSEVGGGKRERTDENMLEGNIKERKAILQWKLGGKSKGFKIEEIERKKQGRRVKVQGNRKNKEMQREKRWKKIRQLKYSK